MRKIGIFIVIILFLWGCTTFSRSYKLGTEAAVNKKWDEAVKYYEKAVNENPKNSVYKLALVRARLAASYSHHIEAQRLASLGKKEEALAEYEIALSYDPSNRRIADEAKSLTGEETEEKKPEVAKIEPPVKLLVNGEKIQLKFMQEASLRSIFIALGKHARVNIIFDEQFKDIPFSIDLADRDFEQAINTLCMASKNFYRILDEKTIIIVPDQPLKRAQYELNAIRTFYLSNISAQDIQGSLQQMLRTQFKAPTIIIDKNLNSVSIRDVPEVLELAERIIKLWDKPKGEIVIDLEIMEASRTKLRELGVDLSEELIGLRYSGPDETGWYSLKGLDFSKSENFQITLPTAFLQFLESDSDTKIIAQPRLRGLENEDITYIVGDEIPIPRTTFTPIAAGGVSQQPITNFEYKNVGIEIKLIPRIHQEREITLEIDMKIKSIGGSGFANIPILTTREVKNIIRLKEGETNLLAGLLKDEERKTLKGIVGLKSIPILGHLFSSTDQSILQTDVIMTITPYIIRTIPLSVEDAKPIWVNLVDTTSTAAQTPRRVPVEELLDLEMRRTRLEQEREEPGNNQIFLNPSNFEVPQNREFRVNVNIRSSEEIGNMSIDISFNAQVIELQQVVAGGFVQQFGKDPSFLKNIDNSSGVCTIGFSSPDLNRGFRGTGEIATLVFGAKEKGESVVSVSSVGANDPTGKVLSFETRQAQIRVR